METVKTVALIMPGRDPETLVSALRSKMPGWQILADESVDRSPARYALAWKPDDGIWQHMPHLRGIMSLGAGVQHLLQSDGLPKVPLGRFVDAQLARDMADYVLAQILAQQRELWRYREDQKKTRWRPRMPRTGKRVGVLGLGEMGRAVADRLRHNGFSIAGWSRTARTIAGIDTWSGDTPPEEMLVKANYLICLLPATEATRGVLNEQLFEALPVGAVVINVGRGSHLVEGDAMAALESGRLGALVVDVFDSEPLSGDHPFWHHPRVFMTPHCASLSRPDNVARAFADFVRALEAGEPPPHPVDRELGY